MAGNEDWYNSNSSIKIVPASSGDFGYAVFGVSRYIDSHPQIGLNEKGLGVDWATIPQSKFVHHPKRLPLITPLIPELMKRCESVGDVIRFIEKYNIPHFAAEHLLVADRFGDAIVLEWHNETVQVVTTDKKYQLITNFNILAPSTGWYPCDRFSAGESILKAERGHLPSIEYIAMILDAMHSEGKFQTLYSYVFDLQKESIVLYNRFDFSRKTTLNLEDLLKKGKQTLEINDLVYQ
ncbi:MAG: linear amide C-N hydrolase [Desulfobacteraceae bacterium]|nr:linear amide C-N hydrolase [Desulfobacteraceae bacterium]